MSTTRTRPATRGHGPVAERSFALGDLRQVRALVGELGRTAGLDGRRADEATVAVNELATNSVDHGGGHGTLRAWVVDDALVVEVADAGRFADPAAAGRVRPRLGQARGRGLWIARHLADSLEFRATGEGTVARLVVRR